MAASAPNPALNTIGPDSTCTRGFVQSLGFDPAELERELTDHGPWVSRDEKAMLYRGHKLKRSKCFLMRGAPVKNGQPAKLFKYTYPGFQYASLRFYRSWESLPVLSAFLTKLEVTLKWQDCAVDFNHLIVTLYEKESDEIGAHQDKMHDIEPDTPILSISLGDEREFVLEPLQEKKEKKEKSNKRDEAAAAEPARKRSKMEAGASASASADASVVHLQRHVQILRAGDLFVLGPKTNATMTHAITPIAKEELIKRTMSETGARQFKPRMSLVLRQIKTSMTLEEVAKRIDQAKAAQNNAKRKRERDQDAEDDE